MDLVGLRVLGRTQLEAYLWGPLSQTGYLLLAGTVIGQDARGNVYGAPVRKAVRYVLKPHPAGGNTAESSLEIPAFDLLLPWDAAPPVGADFQDSAGKVYTSTGPPQDVGLQGLRIMWQIGLRQPEGRGAA